MTIHELATGWSSDKTGQCRDAYRTQSQEGETYLTMHTLEGEKILMKRKILYKTYSWSRIYVGGIVVLSRCHSFCPSLTCPDLCVWTGESKCPVSLTIKMGLLDRLIDDTIIHTFFIS